MDLLRFQVGETLRFGDLLEFSNSKSRKPKLEASDFIDLKVSNILKLHDLHVISLPASVSSLFLMSHHPFIPPVHLQVDSSNPLVPGSTTSDSRST